MYKIVYVVKMKIHWAEDACTVEETHCEGATGSGLEAHCKQARPDFDAWY